MFLQHSSIRVNLEREILKAKLSDMKTILLLLLVACADVL